MNKIRPYILILLAAGAAFAGWYVGDFASIRDFLSEMQPGLFALCNAVLLALLCALFCSSVISGRIKSKDFLNTFLRRLVAAVVCAGVGAAIGTAVRGVNAPMDKLIPFIAVPVVVIVLNLVFYLRSRKLAVSKGIGNSVRKSAAASSASRHSVGAVFGTLFVSVVAVVLAFVLKRGEADILVPVAAAILAMLLWRITGWRLWLLAGSMIVAFQAVVTAFVLEPSVFAAAEAAVVAYLDSSLFIGMADLYTTKGKIK